ncbi:MAG: hypothetical protein H0Z33_16160 [Bacillaceae bacterium]|nr:hypothetical protein [Bacillaceae bacterium]
MQLLYNDWVVQLKDKKQVVALIEVKPRSLFAPVVGGMDRLLLVINSDSEDQHIINLTFEDMRVQVRFIGFDNLKDALYQRLDSSWISWLQEGRLIYDKNKKVQKLKDQFFSLNADIFDQKLFVEFALFLKKYMESRQYLKTKNYLDSFNSVLQAIHHWARIQIIHDGLVPEVTVWEQVKEIDPAVHKLYHELVTTKEPLEKRIELVLLASEFSVMSRLEDSTRYLVSIMDEKQEPWSIEELMQHPRLKEYDIDLNLVLEKMAARDLVEALSVPVEGTVVKGFDDVLEGQMIRKYKIKK